MEVLDARPLLTHGPAPYIKRSMQCEYPAWSEVNHRLKRTQDPTALDSLKWLMREGRKHHTVVSLHINALDAYEDSPLWQEYLQKDIINVTVDTVTLAGIA